jgi:hypothetical protein
MRTSVAGPPRLRPEIALIAGDVAALLNTIPRVVRNAVSAVVAVASRVVIGLNGIVVSESLEIGSNDPRQVFACRTLFRRHNGGENRIV